MTLQATVRALPRSERTMLSRAAFLFDFFTIERFRRLGARLMAALDESARREGEKLVRRHRHLIHTHHPEI